VLLAGLVEQQLKVVQKQLVVQQQPQRRRLVATEYFFDGLIEVSIAVFCGLDGGQGVELESPGGPALHPPEPVACEGRQLRVGSGKRSTIICCQEQEQKGKEERDGALGAERAVHP